MIKLLLTLLSIVLLVQMAAAAPSSTQKWSKATLTYAIDRTPMSLTISKEDVLAAFRYSFDQFSTVLPQKFTEVKWDSSKPADIKIDFSLIIRSTKLSKGDFKIELESSKEWKYFKPGEKRDDPKKVDLVWAALNQIRALLQVNNVKGADSIRFYESYPDYLWKLYSPTVRVIPF